jgi:hypothetical protein
VSRRGHVDDNRPRLLRPVRHVLPAALSSLDECEDALHEFISRCENLLTHNLALLVGDLIVAEEVGDGLSSFKGLAAGAGEAMLGNLAGIAPSRVAGKGVAALDRILFGIRGVKFFGGLIGFIVGAIAEAVVSDLLDRSAEIIRSTAEQRRRGRDRRRAPGRRDAATGGARDDPEPARRARPWRGRRGPARRGGRGHPGDDRRRQAPRVLRPSATRERSLAMKSPGLHPRRRRTPRIALT